MKKILIVGGAGYVGGFMTDVFEARKDYQVTVYDNLLYETRYLKDVDFIYGDIRDKEKLGAILNDYDIVVWLAALVGDGACAIDTKLTRQINVEATEWMVDHFHGTVVYMSTCSVYGKNDALIDEDALPNPLSVYAETKLEAERYIVEHAKDHLIFRLGTLYGIGDLHSRLRFDLVVNILTLRAVEGKPLSVFGGQQWRPILHVRDVSYAVEYCLDHDVRGLFNISERNVEIAHLAAEIQRHIPGAVVQHQDIPFEDLRDYKVITDRICATGWKPKYDLSDGIEEMKRVFSAHRVVNTDDPVYSNVAFLKSTTFWRE